MEKYFFLVSFLYIIGLSGMYITRKNIILLLMCIELMLLGINLNFVVFSVYLDDFGGQIFAMFVLTLAAAESSIGLAILVIFYRLMGTVLINRISNLKG